MRRRVAALRRYPQDSRRCRRRTAGGCGDFSSPLTCHAFPESACPQRSHQRGSTDTLVEALHGGTRMSDGTLYVGPFQVESSGNLGGTWHAELWVKCWEKAVRLARIASTEDRGERIYRVYDASTEYTLAHFRSGVATSKERGWN